MKKYNKLFAILFAVLGVATLKAQTDVTSTYLTNAGFDDETSFVNNGVCTYAKDCSANGTTLSQMQPVNGWTFGVANGDARASGAYAWGAKHFLGGNGYTIPSTDEEGNIAGGALGICAVWDAVLYYYQEVTLAPGVYELSYCVYNSGSGATAVNKNLFGFVADNGTSYYGATKTFTSNSWKTESVSFTLTTETKGKISVGIDAANAGSGASHHLFVDYIKLTHKSFDDVSAGNPADFTSLIVNPSFENGNLDGWTVGGYSSDTGVKPNSNGTYTTSGVDGNYLFNTWWKGTPLTQTVANIPNGIYELKVLLASDQNAKLFLLANGEHSDVYTITTDNKTFHDVSYEFKVLTGQVTIGVIGGNDAGEYVDGGHWWYKADNFRLTYKGADISLEKEALDAALAKAKAIDQTTIPGIVATSLNSAINIAENVEYALNPIKAATNELLAVLTTVDEVQAPYIETKALITSSNSMLTNSTASDADKATFQNTITKAEEDLNNATDKATIDAIAVTIMNAQKAYCLVAAPTEGHPFDMTHLIVNPKFDQDKTGWNSDGGAQNKAIASNKPEPITGKFYENWNPSNFTGSIYQEISGLPNGTYKLKAAAFGNNAVLFANDATTQMADNDNTPAWYEVEVKVSGGTLKFGVQNNNNTGWMGIDNVSLQFIAALDLSEFISAYEAAHASAVAARDNAEYTHITGIERTNLVNAINQPIAEETKEAYQEATQSLANATNAFIAAKSDYDILAAEIIIAKGLGMTDDRINGITAGKTGAVAYPDLKVDEYNYIQGTYTENATLGSWREDFGGDLDGEGYKAGGPKYLDDWQGNKTTRTAKQTVTLPAGDYALSVIARGQAGASGNLYYKIGDVTTDVALIMKGNRGRGVDVNGVANFSEEGEYNCDGEGFGWEYRFITFRLDTETQVEIGASVTIQGQWASVYAPVLLTTEASVKALRLSEIATALGNVPTGKMDASIQNILNNAVADAEEVTSASTIDELNYVSTALTEAIANAKASVEEYAAIKTYIDKADKIDASIAADYKSQYEEGSITETATKVFQALEVATYNCVKTNFNYDVALSSEWTKEGPVGELSDQHWSGEKRPYMEQSSAAWGANAWDISYDQDLTLPAGEYVFKVAGRKASGDGCTLSLIVTKGDATLGIVNDFPEGDTGYGIDTNGAANFSDEGTYANEDKGRGWQWRYVKFTLDEAATVNIAVKAKATTNHQWISFCDATVQMTEETYLEANKGGLDAPTAAAEALVDTKPMGTAENTALQAALDMPVTTGAELQAKINALNTAVANANTWVAAYNEAKAPLVAALERFEAELNDGVNGCKYNMVEDEDVWATLITEVGEAACAKDATNDYSGFANAAEELNKAINDVHNWIRTNPTLNAKSATAVDMTNYYLVNASFDEGNTNGWTKTGSQTNNVAWSVTDGTFTATPSGSHYTGDAIWQKVNLAKGAYKLTVNLKAQEVVGHPSQVFVADAAPSWDNNLSDLIASVIVTEFNKDVELSCIFNIAADADVYIGFNQKAGNVANTGIQGSYTIYDFTLTQAANQIITKDGVITVVGENEAADLAGISSDENIVKVDLTGAMWSEASTLDIVNKNSLVYVTDDTDLTANNIVKVGVDEKGNTTRVAESIVLTEGYKFAAREAFTATKLNYDRKFSANWLTVCLPFAYDIPENVKVETLSAVDLDTKTFTFEEVNEKMEANKPYIIKNSSETAALFAELVDVAVEATPEAMTVEVTAEGSEHKAEFIGTYTALKTNALMEITEDVAKYDILFFGNDGQLYYLSNGVTTKVVNIKPFRAYIRLPKGAINWSDGQQAIARHGKRTTSIDNAELATDNAPVIYDLMGRKVIQMQKGHMYIVNGKKVVIK